MTLEDIFKEQDNNKSDSLTTEKKKKENNIALEKTLEIETLDLNVYLDKESKTEKPLEQKPPVIDKKQEPENIDVKPKDKDNSLQDAFINCSVLAFITAFIGAGWLINIINHI